MSFVLTVLAASVTTLAGTNLDDIVLLTVFFARRLPTRRIVAGQYLGFAAIVAVSFAVNWRLTLAVPRMWLRLLGVLPIAVGLKELIQIHKSKSATAAQARGSAGVLSIAAATLANGADNIGVYVPFFIASRHMYGWSWWFMRCSFSCGVLSGCGLEVAR